MSYLPLILSLAAIAVLCLGLPRARGFRQPLRFTIGLRISTLLAFLKSPLAAQRNASFEVGAFAQATYFDRTLPHNAVLGRSGVLSSSKF
jgi:hypothetical protein